MEYQSVFSDLAKRREFLKRLNTIEGFDLPATDENLRRRRPNLKFALLKGEGPLQRFIGALDWFVEQLEQAR